MALDKLGTHLSHQGKHALAEPLYRRGLAIREKALGPAHPAVAESHYNLASLLRALGKTNEARSLQERALRIQEQALGPEHTDVADGLSNLALILRAEGTYTKAGPLYERALRIYESVLGPDHPSVASALNNLADLAGAKGDYDESQRLYERALTILKKAHGTNHPTVVAGLTSYAGLLYDRGAYEEARSLLEHAVAVGEKELGARNPILAVSLNNLAMLRMAEGDYADARLLFERALAIREEVLGEHHPEVATTLNNLAQLLDLQGASAEARRLHERALAIREDLGGPRHPLVAASLNNLALCLQTQGELDAARPLLERALAIHERSLGPDHPDVATSLANLATLLSAQGAYAEARPHFERALAIKERKLGPDHPSIAVCLDNLARWFQDQGNYAEARPLFERAVAMYEALLGKDHPDVAQSLQHLAVQFALEGEYERARPLYERALALTSAHVRAQFAGLSSPQRLEFLRLSRHYLDEWLLFAPLVGRSGYAEVLRFRGQASRAEAAERTLVRRSGEEERELRTSLLVAQRRAARLTHEFPPAFRKEARSNWQRQYAEATAELERITVELGRRSAPMRGAWERLDMGLPDVQEHIAADEVLVDVLRVADHYEAWIVRSVGEPTRIDLGPAEIIEAASARFVERAASPESSTWREAGAALSELVLAPLRKEVPQDIRTLVVCPDASLAAVPFAALPGLGDGRFLGDGYLVINVSMAQDLVPWENPAPAGEGALLLGGIDYGEAAEEPPVLGARPGLHARPHRAPRGDLFLALPGAEEEVRSIGPLLGEEATQILGSDATEARLRAASKGTRVLHLATHGFVRTELMEGLERRGGDKKWLGAGMERQLARGYDPMLLAGLAMAGANVRDGGHGDDGILTALEASHLDLDGVELVVLSTCSSALGTAASGEGLIGLVRGFQMAGAGQVLGSLWKVDDEATKALMIRFYELWHPAEGEGLAAAEALRRAQQFVRAQEPWRHPYFWAAWVLWGAAD